jgi:hypothetical protein
MRTIRLTALLAALVLAHLSAAGAVAATTGAPGLRFLDLIPVKVHGSHFVPGERVRLTLRAGAATRVRAARAAAGGGFTVAFGTLAERDRCSGLIAVTAVGARGDRASYKLPATACPAMTSGPYR